MWKYLIEMCKRYFCAKGAWINEFNIASLWNENRSLVLTIFNEGLIWQLSQSSRRSSIYFSLIVISRSNLFLEPTSTKQYGKVSCSRKQLGPLMGLEPTISTLPVKHTQCPTPPLDFYISLYFTWGSLFR